MENSRLRILLVDDDEDDYLITRDLLTESRSEMFDLEWISTYDAAIEAMRRDNYDIYLLDYSLGEHSGLELLKEAVRNDFKVPTILLTGQGDQEVAIEAMKVGAADYLIKGKVDSKILERSIRYALERKEAENALKHSYEFTKTVLDSMNDAISIIGVGNFKIIGVNKAFLKEFRLKEEDVIGKTCHEITHQSLNICTGPDDICPISEIVKTGNPKAVEHVHYANNGEKIYVEVSVSPITDDSGNVIQVVHISRDITERKLAEEALRLSEEKFSLIFHSSPDWIAITRMADGRYIDVNNAFLNITGYSREEVIGHTSDELGIWIDPDVRTQMLRILNEQGKVHNYEARLRTRSGEIITALWSAEIFELNGERYRITLIRNITERKWMEDQLLESQRELLKNHQELNTLFEAVETAKKEWENTMDCIGDMVILVDKEGKVKRYNRAVTEFTGKEHAEIAGKDWRELIFENEAEIGTPSNYELEHFHKQTGKWFVINSYPFKDLNGNESGTVITIHDNTKMKMLTESIEMTNKVLDKERRELQFALDEISTYIQQVGNEQDLKVRFNNPNLRKCHEIMNCSNEHCPCYGKEAMRCWQIAGTYCGGKIQGVFADKYKNCAECPAFKFATLDPIYQIGEYFNNMMHMLELKQKELEKAYSDLKAAQSQILQQEKMASIGQLAAGVAHEINNPIGFISSNLGTLDKYVVRLNEFIKVQSEVVESLTVTSAVLEKLNEKKKQLKLDYIISDTRELIKESLDGADRVKKIVQDLKSFSRVDEAEYKYADINECMESTINIVWNELKYKTTLRKEYGDIPLTKCYPQQLNQVFMNLLVNAAHAIEKKGEITVSTLRENNHISISISDTGCGIPGENFNRIFEPFFTTKEAGKGTGLGLSITYDIVKKHNGEITVQSEVGKGTTFKVLIPVIEER